MSSSPFPSLNDLQCALIDFKTTQLPPPAATLECLKSYLQKNAESCTLAQKELHKMQMEMADFFSSQLGQELLNEGQREEALNHGAETPAQARSQKDEAAIIQMFEEYAVKSEDLQEAVIIYNDLCFLYDEWIHDAEERAKA